jgi:ankyrin repeat protein
MTRRLLKRGADPTLPDGLGENLLFHAVQFQSPKLAAMLLKEYRMDPNSMDSSGNTALAVAINSMNGKRQIECVRVLLEAGANPWVTWGAGDVLQAIDTYQEHNGQWFPDRRAIAALLREARGRAPKPAGFPEWQEWQERQAATTR